MANILAHISGGI